MDKNEIAALVRLADDAVDEDDTFRYECAVTLAVGVRALVARVQLLESALDNANGVALSRAEACDRLAAKNKRLRDALRALMTRLDEIAEHPSYKGQITTAWVHGVVYTGPTWEEPYAAAARALGVVGEEEV